MTIFIETHALQNLGPNNLNRDDMGTPKTVTYGGVARARVSSQCWKRAVRTAIASELGEITISKRSQLVADELEQKLRERNVQDVEHIARLLIQTSEIIPQTAKRDEAEAKEIKKSENGKANTYRVTEALLLMGTQVYDMLADAGIEAESSGDPEQWCKDNAKELKSIPFNDHAIDVALFGRMSTSSPKLNVDASCQFAHAIGVDRLEMETDFYTAVDEVKKDSSGAGMMGDIEFNASTVYRYANINLDRFATRMTDNDATAKAVSAFVNAFTTSMPTGKMNSFAGRTLPELLVVTVRDTQPINLVGSFQEPVKSPTIHNASKALAETEASYERAWGMKPMRSWVVAANGVADDVYDVFGQPSDFATVRKEIAEFVQEKLSA